MISGYYPLDRHPKATPSHFFSSLIAFGHQTVVLRKFNLLNCPAIIAEATVHLPLSAAALLQVCQIFKVCRSLFKNWKGHGYQFELRSLLAFIEFKKCRKVPYFEAQTVNFKSLNVETRSKLRFCIQKNLQILPIF